MLRFFIGSCLFLVSKAEFQLAYQYLRALIEYAEYFSAFSPLYFSVKASLF